MPKRLKDLTRDELLSITEEETEKLLDLEAAFEGISFVPAPSETILEPQQNKDVTVYNLDGWFTTDLTLIESVLELLNKHSKQLVTVDYDYNFSYDYKYAKPSSAIPQLNKEERMSFEGFELFRNSFKEQVKLAKHNKSEWDKRNSYLSKLSNISDELWKAKQDARNDIQHEEQLRMIYAHYLEVAEGDKSVAFKFFKDAKPDDVKLLISLMAEVTNFDNFDEIMNEGKDDSD